jgi:hypothetical protein
VPTARIVLALVRHLCPCGTPYVVSLARDDDLGNHPEWHGIALAAAAAIDEGFVDGREPGFFCPSCSRLHVRASVSTSVQLGSDEPLLSVSLN